MSSRKKLARGDTYATFDLFTHGFVSVGKYNSKGKKARVSNPWFLLKGHES